MRGLKVVASRLGYGDTHSIERSFRVARGASKKESIKNELFIETISALRALAGDVEEIVLPK